MIPICREDLASLICRNAVTHERYLVAIDGRCASGKTTLAAELARNLGAAVIHMDHFFLRPEQRTPERLETPGENIDHERFLEEVLLPLREGRCVVYRPYSCLEGRITAPIPLTNARIYIIEGSYACHPSLRYLYNLRIFSTVAPGEQMQRIRLRDGEAKAAIFRDRWIPMEEAYILACSVEACCDLLIR